MTRQPIAVELVDVEDGEVEPAVATVTTVALGAEVSTTTTTTADDPASSVLAVAAADVPAEESEATRVADAGLRRA